MKKNTDSHSLCRRACRWILRGVLVLIAVLMLAAGCFAWWLWGWQVGGLSFHESWTPEQRAELQALHDNHVKGMVRDYLALQEKLDAALSNIKDSPRKEFAAGLIKQEFFPLHDLPAFIQYIELSIGFRPVCIRMDEVLRHVAATGRADYYCAENNLSAAYIAARCGKLDLVKELVLRGNDPNLPLRIRPEGEDDANALCYETVFQASIACVPYFSGEAPPLTQRLELLDWLLAHGADINAYARQGRENMALLIATIACMHENEQLPPEQRGLLLLWLLDHGLQVDVDRDSGFLNKQLAACNPSLLPRIMEKVYPSSPTPEQKARILRSFLESGVQDKAAKVRWALEVLGADPNLPIMREKSDEEDLDRQETPTMKLAVPRVFLPLEEEDEAEFNEQLAALDILLAHGGRMDRPGSDAPEIPALRERYFEVLRQNGIDLQMPDGLDIARLCALMQQTGTLQEVQDILAQEHISTLYCDERQKLAQAVLQGGAEDAPEKLAWLLSKGSLPKALSYWEAAWRPYMDAASMSPETQAAAFKQLQLLDQLLSADDDLPSPQQLTPADPELKARYLDILKNHHIDPAYEETP